MVAAALQYRWAYRLGRPLRGELSTINREHWEKVRPLVEKAWVAATSTEVDRIARRIVRMLDLKEHELPARVVAQSDRCGGARRRNDAAEERSPRPPRPMREGEMPEGRSEPFDGELLPEGHREGSGSYRIEPKPYAELEERAAPMARELIEELALEPTPDEPEPAERGGRLSVRQYLRDRERPFLVRHDESPEPPRLALRVVVDHSTSMNQRRSGRTRMESVAEGSMMLHLACAALGLDHQVAVTPQQATLADPSSGEGGKALIAGMVPALTGWEDVSVAVSRHSTELIESAAAIRIILVLHDGYPNDGEVAKKLCLDLRGKVEVIGILLDPDDATRAAMGDIFGADRLVACRANELPKKLAAMLRSIRGI